MLSLVVILSSVVQPLWVCTKQDASVYNNKWFGALAVAAHKLVVQETPLSLQFHFCDTSVKSHYGAQQRFTLAAVSLKSAWKEKMISFCNIF